MTTEQPVNLNLAMQNVHHHIEGLFEQARSSVARARTTPQGSAERLAVRPAVLALLDALGSHHRAEDEYLFPRVAALGADAAARAHEYADDHVEVVRAMSRTQAAVDSAGGAEDLRELGERLAEVERAMSGHFGREEGGIDPYLDRLDVRPAEVSHLLGSAAWQG